MGRPTHGVYVTRGRGQELERMIDELRAELVARVDQLAHRVDAAEWLARQAFGLPLELERRHINASLTAIKEHTTNSTPT